MLKKHIKRFWETPIRELSGIKRKTYRFIKVLAISAHAFFTNQCTLRASALTFYTLLSIVPVVAMSFAIAKGFGFQLYLEDQLTVKFQEHKEVIEQIIIFSKNLLENTKGGLLATLGIIVFIWSIIKVLNNIERAMNDIWGIKKQRPLRKKFSDYLAMMLIGPIVFFLASSITVFIVSTLESYIVQSSLHDKISASLVFFIRLTPYCLIWILFSFIYFFMPNTKVTLSAAIIGGVIGGTTYQIVQRLYLKFQIGASSYGAIYGSFAALPLFLLWIQLSWIIVLVGAEISFAWQNIEMYEFGYKDKPLSHRLTLILSIVVTSICVHRFLEQKSPVTIKKLFKKTKIPTHFLQEIVFKLVECEILNEVHHPENGQIGYQPGVSVANLYIKDIMDRLDKLGLHHMPQIKEKVAEKIEKVLDTFSKHIEKSSKNILVKDLFKESL